MIFKLFIGMGLLCNIFLQAGDLNFKKISIPEESLIYTPEEMLSFDIKEYLKTNAPDLVEYSEVISHWSGYYTISPKVLITLMEHQTHLITETDLNKIEKPLSSMSKEIGFSNQLKDVSFQLAKLYYSDKKTKFSQKSLSASRAFEKIYGELFTNIKRSRRLTKRESNLIPPDNLLQLPYPEGEAWYFGGSHTSTGLNSYPQSSLDFNNGGSWNSDTSNKWIVASNSGTVIKHSSCLLEVIGKSGWSTTYYHLDNIIVSQNQEVSKNSKLANYAGTKSKALCDGGYSSAPHVHFSLKYNGSYQHLNKVKLSGYEVHTGRDSYDTDCNYFWIKGDKIKYCANKDSLYNKPYIDKDNDGISDEKEKELGLNPNSKDSDGDGISDNEEIGDVNRPTDSDGDGVIDALDRDSDNDGILDIDESINGTDPRDSSDFIHYKDYDFNGDGIADILWRKGRSLHLWYMDADGSHQHKYVEKISTIYTIVGIDDFNGDGKSDILWKKGKKYYIWYMNEDSSHRYKYIGSLSSYKLLGISDFNKDGIADILWRKGKKICIWYMKSNGKHLYKSIGNVPNIYKIVNTSDFNGDGIADILWQKGSRYYLWYMKNNGKHIHKYITKLSSIYKILAIADFNGDGISDIIWKKGSRSYIWYMKSNGKHTYKYLATISSAYKIAQTSDLNDDGIADIVWRKKNRTYIWYMNYDGSHSYKYLGSLSTDYVVQQP